MPSYYTQFGANDDLNIPAINKRLAELDYNIGNEGGGASPMSVAYLYDTQTANTEGGAASATTWHTRTLNTEVDPAGIVSIDTNKFTPVEGDYVLVAQAPGYWVDEHKLRLYDVTGASVIVVGQNSYAPTFHTTVAELVHVFTADGETEYRIDHYTKSARAISGLGKAINEGAEVYTTVMLMKIG